MKVTITTILAIFFLSSFAILGASQPIKRVSAESLYQVTTELGQDIIWEEIKQLLRPDFIGVRDVLGDNYINHRSIVGDPEFSSLDDVYYTQARELLSIALYSVGNCGEQASAAAMLSSLFNIPSAQAAFRSFLHPSGHTFLFSHIEKDDYDSLRKQAKQRKTSENLLLRDYSLKNSSVLDVQTGRHGKAAELIPAYRVADLFIYIRFHGNILKFFPDYVKRDLSSFDADLFERYGNNKNPGSGTIMTYEMQHAIERTIGTDTNPFMPLQYMVSYIRDLLLLKEETVQPMTEELHDVPSETLPVVSVFNYLFKAVNVKFQAYQTSGSKYLVTTQLEGLRTYQARALMKLASQLISRSGYKVLIRDIRGVANLVIDYDTKEVNTKPFIIKKNKEAISPSMTKDSKGFLLLDTLQNFRF